MMNNYERLTLHMITSMYDYKRENLKKEEQMEIYDRLCELEDKIEEGKLVEIKEIYKWLNEALYWDEEGVCVRFANHFGVEVEK